MLIEHISRVLSEPVLRPLALRLLSRLIGQIGMDYQLHGFRQTMDELFQRLQVTAKKKENRKKNQKEKSERKIREKGRGDP